MVAITGIFRQNMKVPLINNDTFEPFRRYEKMLDKYLGKYPEANYPEWPDARPVEGGGISLALCSRRLKERLRIGTIMVYA